MWRSAAKLISGRFLYGEGGQLWSRACGGGFGASVSGGECAPGTARTAASISVTQDEQCMGTAKVSWKGGRAGSADIFLAGVAERASRRSGDAVALR